MQDNLNIKPYLTFKLAHELYAFEIEKVREVLDYTNITRIPKALPFLSGVINLRGSVVVVIDLRQKFGLEKIEKTLTTSIIIIEINVNSENLILGVLVDAVQEVIELEFEKISPPPKLGMELNAQFIKGLGRKENEFLIVLDVDKIFSQEELSQLKVQKKEAA